MPTLRAAQPSFLPEVRLPRARAVAAPPRAQPRPLTPVPVPEDGVGGGTALLTEREPSSNGLFTARPLARPAITPAIERELEPSSEAGRLETPSLHLLADEIKFLSWALDGLTDREREVVFTICAGGTNEGMADRLCIALPTLRTHLMRLNQKLGTTSKGDVVRFVAATLLKGYRRGEIAISR